MSQEIASKTTATQSPITNIMAPRISGAVAGFIVAIYSLACRAINIPTPIAQHMLETRFAEKSSLRRQLQTGLGDLVGDDGIPAGAASMLGNV